MIKRFKNYWEELESSPTNRLGRGLVFLLWPLGAFLVILFNLYVWGRIQIPFVGILEEGPWVAALVWWLIIFVGFGIILGIYKFIRMCLSYILYDDCFYLYEKQSTLITDWGKRDDYAADIYYAVVVTFIGVLPIYLGLYYLWAKVGKENK